MALPDPISLKNAGGTVMSMTRRLPIPNGNRYVHTSATPAVTFSTEVRNLFVTPKKGDNYNRSIASFNIQVVDADDIPHTGSVSLSVVRPVATDITDAYMNDLFAMLNEFLIAASGDYLLRFRRGEV